MNHQSQLPLWKACDTQPRDNHGRFVKIEHSMERKLVLGMQPDIRLAVR